MGYLNRNNLNNWIMRHLLMLALLVTGLIGQAQMNYFTAYNFTVEPQNVGAVYNLVDTFYKAHKPDGVTVWLYENHFNDAGNNHTHSIVFAGSLDALGNMYNGMSTDFQLFLTRINAQIKDGYSAVSGTVNDTYAGGDGPFNYRQLYQLKVADSDAFTKSFAEFNSKNTPPGKLVTMGQINMGRSPDGETHFVLVGFQSFKAALAGARALVPANQQANYDKAWDAHMAASGDIRVVRSSLMVVMGEW